MRLRRDTRKFKRCALNSLLLAIEIFNRPHEVGRVETVLILLQHAFEMFLKGAIYQQRGAVSESKGSITYSFDKCIEIARSDLALLDEDQASTLSILDGLRDCAVHNLIQLTEQALYVYTQAAVTLFDEKLNYVFQETLADHLPSRVLPISTSPPQDMITFIDSEFRQIQELLSPGKRRQSEARCRLRHFIIMESNLSGEHKQPTENEISHVVSRVKNGNTWQVIFPSIASVQLDTQGHGPTVSIRLTRQSGAAPVRIVREGEPDSEEATIIREVDTLDRYSMNVTNLAQHVGLTRPRTSALICYLGLQDDSDCYKEYNMGQHSVYKRYSPKAQAKLREALETVDMEEIWQQYGVRGGPRPRSNLPGS